MPLSTAATSVKTGFLPTTAVIVLVALSLAVSISLTTSCSTTVTELLSGIAWNTPLLRAFLRVCSVVVVSMPYASLVVGITLVSDSERLSAVKATESSETLSDFNPSSLKTVARLLSAVSCADALLVSWLVTCQ